MGLTLFVGGLVWPEKCWLRQDLAGGGALTIVPTVVGGRAPGLGVVGRL